MKVYIVGNPLVYEDSLPYRILSKLRERLPDVEFVELDTVEEIEEKNPVIIDTVLDIKDVMVIDDINKIIVSKTCTTHDYDLGIKLKLLSKIGRIKSFKVIGVPVGFDECEAVENIVKYIKGL